MSFHRLPPQVGPSGILVLASAWQHLPILHTKNTRNSHTIPTFQAPLRSTMAQNGSKLSQMAQNGSKLSQMAQNGSKRLKMVPNAPNNCPNTKCPNLVASQAAEKAGSIWCPHHPCHEFLPWLWIQGRPSGSQLVLDIHGNRMEQANPMWSEPAINSINIYSSYRIQCSLIF